MKSRLKIEVKWPLGSFVTIKLLNWLFSPLYYGLYSPSSVDGSVTFHCMHTCKHIANWLWDQRSQCWVQPIVFFRTFDYISLRCTCIYTKNVGAWTLTVIDPLFSIYYLWLEGGGYPYLDKLIYCLHGRTGILQISSFFLSLSSKTNAQCDNLFLEFRFNQKHKTLKLS